MRLCTSWVMMNISECSFVICRCHRCLSQCLLHKGGVPGEFGLHNMSSGGLRFRNESLEPRKSLESLRTAQGLPCDAVDLLWYEIRCENSSQHHWLMIILLWHRFASAQKKKCCSAQEIPIKLWLRSLAFSISILKVQLRWNDIVNAFGSSTNAPRFHQ